MISLLTRDQLVDEANDRAAEEGQRGEYADNLSEEVNRCFDLLFVSALFVSWTLT